MFFCWMNMNWMWSEEISWNNMNFHYWVVVSNIFYFHPYLGKWSNLTNIFQRGWFNHQLDYVFNQWLFILVLWISRRVDSTIFLRPTWGNAPIWLTFFSTDGGGKKRTPKTSTRTPGSQTKTPQIMDLSLTWPVAKLWTFWDCILSRIWVGKI